MIIEKIFESRPVSGKGAETSGEGIDWHPLSPGQRATGNAEYHSPTQQTEKYNKLAEVDRRGIGHDLWYAIIPNEHGTATAQRPMNATSLCTLCHLDEPECKPEPPEVTAEKQHKKTEGDFRTVGQFLDHKSRIVYPGLYNLNTQNTMWSPSKMRTLDPAKDLDVYKMIDPLMLQRYVRRQAYDRGITIEKDQQKRKHIADELLEEGHRFLFYTYMDQRRNMVIATDSYDYPTHDPSDLPFLRWVQRFGLLERLETFAAPSGHPAVVEELSWRLIRPFVYVVRIPPSGNCKATTLRFHDADKDCNRAFGKI
mmetsp:Transcript_28620/g.62668  ORF Transcript_28620/g.62668 Transcript_28620/m.62668 type:complete len:311 (-) Transcript_28620:13-945(-)